MNRLHQETSLYLRQHANNPVHWQPWDQAALDSARDAGRPILLSIGYSACHWCHVMAHESFEDEATAAVMNRLFVNIKVDREERPDLDRIYQLSHQLLTGSGGGWPLTVFLDPADLVPFFAGTYFPARSPLRDAGVSGGADRYRRVVPGPRRTTAGSGRQAASGAGIHSGRRRRGRGTSPTRRPPKRFSNLRAERVRSRFDDVNGGFGGAPRFPQAPLLEAVAALAEQPSGDGLGRALEFTLEKMAQSGLRDHLDGGFFRYCVDGTWTIPHFEKMLYDNAMLLPLYAEGAARWNNAALGDAAEGIADWLHHHDAASLRRLCSEYRCRCRRRGGWLPCLDGGRGSSLSRRYDAGTLPARLWPGPTAEL